MRTVLRVLYVFSYFLFLFYLFIPSPRFPEPPPGAVMSQEPADTETPLRRAYFTNYSRQEVINHYKGQFNIFTPSIRLNYPPEDAQTLIRDQTRSSYLEELVHPFRESLYINGFVPSQAKDEIWYKGEYFEQKITVRYVPSSTILRVFIITITYLVVAVIFRELLISTSLLYRKVKHARQD